MAPVFRLNVQKQLMSPKLFRKLCIIGLKSLSGLKPEGFSQSHELEKQIARNVDMLINDTNPPNKSVLDF